MNDRQGTDVIRRCPDNPLIRPENLSFPCSDICNAGAVRFRGEYLLLITIEALEGLCSVYLARSRNGRTFTVDDRPFMSAAEDGPFARYETLGIRDPRITFLDETYYITYLAESDHGFRTALGRTDDFERFERIAMLAQPDTKNPVLLPRKIGGRYAMLDRPGQGMSIWISYSDDLRFWGSPRLVMTPRGGFWDADRIGAGAPPVEIDCGWLLIYYGEKYTPGGPLARLGAAILDKDDPSRVVARSNTPILAPRERYERIGDVGNLVFSCGALVDENWDLKLYYGASDSCICLGTASVVDVVAACIETDKGP